MMGMGNEYSEIPKTVQISLNKPTQRERRYARLYEEACKGKQVYIPPNLNS